ncbi:AraC family transcriptional regulator [Agrobacterium sp.]|jgi:AraC-like DNA-binding protein|uniref:helix-turn-helix transcriptional regulator n=1 Tax=Agrobacterium sp. TaxID=361 RepID=UPI0028B2569C|nr:AraC family transcriptional regulator [Agrobacterium sp.]
MTSPNLPKFDPLIGHLDVSVLDGVGNHHVGRPAIELSPKFQLFVYLEGEQQFYIDDVYFHLSAGEGRDSRPKALVMNRVHKAILRHTEKPTQYLRKVMISAPVSWVEDLNAEDVERSPELADFISGHINHFLWVPSRHAIQLASEIADPPPAYSGELKTLFRKAKALELMCLACSALVEQNSDEVSHPTLSAWRQSQKVRDFLLENLDLPLSITEIARETGASVSSVQRHFREHFGQTVFQFIRSKRLEKAREALEREGSTIAQAAYIAGYSDPSNFTNAYKRAFGSAPKYHRA